ncbi:MAG: APC family permease [Phycisphaerae bacterium]|jgi:amino acid transporter
MSEVKTPFNERLTRLIVGGARSVHDRTIFHKLSLAAFLAWVGLGSDGLSSSCYGPPEAFIALKEYPYLGIFVALATAVTIFVISASYSQIIELFPSGGGGYLVASKLLSPRAGAVSGCALLVDYVLTIAISIASGADALFSFLPEPWVKYKLWFAIGVIVVMTLLNIRGARESVVPLVPIFLIFVLAHAFVIVYALATHVTEFGQLAGNVTTQTRQARGALGIWGMLFLLMHSYSMGAGTYTGIEAVSNSMAILREPRVQTAKRTMTYMWISLAIASVGLMLTYMLFNVHEVPGKSLNAVMLTKATQGWSAAWGQPFVIITLISEATILFIAAQTGFLGGPRVLANMATDRWLPTRLSMLSDRLVTRNGILIMSSAAAVTLLGTGGEVSTLVVLYSINVFITFVLSQTGMVRHWWQVRHKEPGWGHRLFINGAGLVMTGFILVWVTVLKFFEGGWVTLVVTVGLVAMVSSIRRHYNAVGKSLTSLNKLAQAVLTQTLQSKVIATAAAPVFDPKAKTAAILVNGFNGLGLHSTQNVIRYFGDSFKNFVFLAVGMVDAGNFKGIAELNNLREHIHDENNRYVDLMQKEGYYAECITRVGTDIADEIDQAAAEVVQKYPDVVFFAGQLIFNNESFFTRLLHNNLVFAVQKRLYRKGVPFVILPFRA